MSLRDNFTLKFSAEQTTALWPCPTCRTGHLFLAMKTVHLQETASSAAWRGHDDWEPEWITERFVAIAVCDTCGEPVSIAGETEHQPTQYYEEQYQTIVTPHFVRPAPIIVPRPKGLPDALEKIIAVAEGLFWSNSGASGNAIRSTIEELLTEQGIRRFATNKRHKRVPVSLHSRIVEFGKKKEQGLADKMLAVKWIGNAGSHARTSLTAADLFDGFDLLHHVLEEVYAQETKRLVKLAKHITKAKGPLSRRPERGRV